VLAALAPVDVQLGVAVGGGDVEVAAVEMDVGVALGQQRIGQRDVRLLAASARRDLLVDVIDLHASSGALHPGRRHGAPWSARGSPWVSLVCQKVRSATWRLRRKAWRRA